MPTAYLKYLILREKVKVRNSDQKLSLHPMSTTATHIYIYETFFVLATYIGHVMTAGRKWKLLVLISLCKEPKWKWDLVLRVEYIHTCMIHTHTSLVTRSDLNTT